MVNSVPDNDENAKLCLCTGCPTYKKSNLGNNLFCARGKAQEKVSVGSCICPECPIFKKYGLKQMYYCSQGKSADIEEGVSSQCLNMYQ